MYNCLENYITGKRNKKKHKKITIFHLLIGNEKGTLMITLKQHSYYTEYQSTRYKRSEKKIIGTVFVRQNA